MCEAVEDEIRRRGGGLAFPVQSSRNDVAAHYCPSPDERRRVYAEGDLAKLDVGVHVDGWVVDTALTVNVGDAPQNRPLVEAARAALEAAIAAAGPGVEVRRISARIERDHPRLRPAARAQPVRPRRRAAGRCTARRPSPTSPDDSTDDVLRPASVVAIEPFATDGAGHVVGARARRRSSASIPRADGDRRRATPTCWPPSARSAGCPSRAGSSRTCRGRAWRRRWPRCTRAGGSPPTRRWWSGRAAQVAQAEHTLYVGPDGWRC